MPSPRTPVGDHSNLPEPTFSPATVYRIGDAISGGRRSNCAFRIFNALWMERLETPRGGPPQKDRKHNRSVASDAKALVITIAWFIQHGDFSFCLPPAGLNRRSKSHLTLPGKPSSRRPLEVCRHVPADRAEPAVLLPPRSLSVHRFQSFCEGPAPQQVLQQGDIMDPIIIIIIPLIANFCI